MACPYEQPREFGSAYNIWQITTAHAARKSYSMRLIMTTIAGHPTAQYSYRPIVETISYWPGPGDPGRAGARRVGRLTGAC
jgi:hypothetical protein